MDGRRKHGDYGLNRCLSIRVKLGRHLRSLVLSNVNVINKVVSMETVGWSKGPNFTSGQCEIMEHYRRFLSLVNNAIHILDYLSSWRKLNVCILHHLEKIITSVFKFYASGHSCNSKR